MAPLMSPRARAASASSSNMACSRKVAWDQGRKASPAACAWRHSSSAGPPNRQSGAARSPITSARAWSASASRVRARASTRCPLSLSTSCLAERSNKGVSRLPSSRRSALDTADGVRCISTATGGVDVYFDNVGGMVSDAVIPQINRRARIVICGQISQYSGGLDAPEMGPRLLHHLLYQRATMQGILARDYVHRMDEMTRIVGPWVRAGEIAFEETIVDGFDNLPSALNSLFTGEHRGKLLVRA